MPSNEIAVECFQLSSRLWLSSNLTTDRQTNRGEEADNTWLPYQLCFMPNFPSSSMHMLQTALLVTHHMVGWGTIHTLFHTCFHQSFLYKYSKLSLISSNTMPPTSSAILYYMLHAQLFLLPWNIFQRTHRLITETSGSTQMSLLP